MRGQFLYRYDECSGVIRQSLEGREAAMQEKDSAREPGSYSEGPTEALSAQDERLWSILSHVSVIVAPIGALIIWLVFKDRSERVRFHALQALWYQVAWLVLIVAYSILSSILTIVVIGIFMFFLLPLIALVPLIHGCYAAYKVSQGEDYRYPFVADKIDESAHRAV